MKKMCFAPVVKQIGNMRLFAFLMLQQRLWLPVYSFLTLRDGILELLLNPSELSLRHIQETHHTYSGEPSEVLR